MEAHIRQRYLNAAARYGWTRNSKASPQLPTFDNDIVDGVEQENSNTFQTSPKSHSIIDLTDSPVMPPPSTSRLRRRVLTRLDSDSEDDSAKPKLGADDSHTPLHRLNLRLTYDKSDESDENSEDENNNDMLPDGTTDIIEGNAQSDDSAFNFDDEDEDLPLPPFIMDRDGLRTPNKSKTPSKYSSTPLATIKHVNTTPSFSTKKFKDSREHVTRELFTEFNQRVFNNGLPKDMEISWSVHLQTTAGITRCSRSIGPLGTVHKARIELSSKVLDNHERLRQTLAHEMCHAAVWLIDKARTSPHGTMFKSWGDKFTAQYDDILVTRCHSYEIAYKYRYTCRGCGKHVGRQSKSIDSQKHRCARCGGEFVLDPKRNADGTPRKERQASGFSLFVQENMSSIRQNYPLTPQKQLMSLLSDEYRRLKLCDGSTEIKK